ncbi:unnamed protein product [Withania somnifera]
MRGRKDPLVIFAFLVLVFANVATSASNGKFTPADNYLINCGSPDSTLLDDGRTFKSDPQSASYLSTDETIFASVKSLQEKVTSFSSVSLLYHTARIFESKSMYRFLVFKPGRHWVRLYFYPLPHPNYNLSSAMFTVTSDSIVLLDDFSVKDTSKVVFKEYLINITSSQFTLKFSPLKKSFSFINAIEFVSAPDDLISDSAAAVSPVGDFNGLSQFAFEVSYRLNIGGPIVTPKNDTLWRTWLPDDQYMAFPEGAQNVSVPLTTIIYPDGGATPLIAPASVYATADMMADSGVPNSNFNLTWEVNVDSSFSYLIRMHFCDIVSKNLNELYFNVYVNEMVGVSSLDLSILTSDLATPYYKDFVLNATDITNGSIIVQVGPTSNVQSILPNAILNGLEVMKMSNMAGSLDGLFSSGGHAGVLPRSRGMRIAAAFGLAMGVTALVLLAMGIVRWRRKPAKGWEKQKTFSSWLPLNASYCSFMSNKSKTSCSTIISSGLNFGRVFTFNEIKNATKTSMKNQSLVLEALGKCTLVYQKMEQN